jgi:hypothetical protein
MCRTTCLSLFLFVLPMLLAGCGSPQKRISGTDLPTIPRVTMTSSEIKSSTEGVATDGKFVFTGQVYDALERLRWISRPYVEAGWTPEKSTGSPSEATQVFSKPLPELKLKRSVKITAIASQTAGSVLVHLYSEPLPSE